MHSVLLSRPRTNPPQLRGGGCGIKFYRIMNFWTGASNVRLSTAELLERALLLRPFFVSAAFSSAYWAVGGEFPHTAAESPSSMKTRLKKWEHEFGFPTNTHCTIKLQTQQSRTYNCPSLCILVCLTRAAIVHPAGTETPLKAGHQSLREGAGRPSTPLVAAVSPFRFLFGFFVAAALFCCDGDNLRYVPCVCICHCLRRSITETSRCR